LVAQIFSFFGVTKGYTWEIPNYTISMALILLCAASAAIIGSMFARQTKVHGMFLWGLFAVTAVLQYKFNSTFSNDEIVTGN
jgi:hypothetical protein